MNRKQKQALAERLRTLATADAADILRGEGFTRVTVDGIKPLVPLDGSVAGPVRTLRFLPNREDLDGPPNGPVNRRLYDTIEAGEVLVVDAMGRTDKAVLGDMMLARIQARQAVAAIIDGAVRDTPVVAEKGLAVFARAACPEPFMTWMQPWETDCPIQCGGVLVRAGDWMLADGDGVVVIPAGQIETVAEAAEKKESADAFSEALLAAGFGLDDAYPLPPHMLPYLERFERDGTLPTREEVAKNHGE